MSDIGRKFWIGFTGIILGALIFFVAVFFIGSQDDDFSWLDRLSLNPTSAPTAVPTPSPTPKPDITYDKPVVSENELRGVWVASVWNIDFPSQQGLSVASMKDEIDEILKTASSFGMNAVFFQVRSCGDALYKSPNVPWSKVLTGTQGVAPGEDFDPLKYIIEQSSQYGIQVHAWLNPFRLTVDGSGTSDFSENNIALKESQWLIEYDGELYFDPGFPQVRQLLYDEITYILNNYDVAGIHLDDYFYPYRLLDDGKYIDFDDSASYSLYGEGEKREDYRRRVINEFIENCWNIVNSIRDTAKFGVSPSGIWANAKDMEGGSDTKGASSYSDYFVDSKKWVKEGWLDYICPQIYWSFDTSYAAYDKILDWWNYTVYGTDVDLYIGHGAYKMGTESPKDWMDPSQLAMQVNTARYYMTYDGSVFYGYNELKSNICGGTEALCQLEGYKKAVES